jgi:hypothetical protein
MHLGRRVREALAPRRFTCGKSAASPRFTPNREAVAKALRDRLVENRPTNLHIRVVRFPSETHSITSIHISAQRGEEDKACLRMLAIAGVVCITKRRPSGSGYVRFFRRSDPVCESSASPGCVRHYVRTTR